MKTLKDLEDMKYPQWAIRQEAIKLIKICRSRRPKKVKGIIKCNNGFKSEDLTERDIFFIEMGRIQALRYFFNTTEEEIENGI